MVKSLATALVCGGLFVAYASAQEVFVGEQKAKPKYPKAEAATGHIKLGIQDNSVAAVPPKKAGAPAKSASAAVVNKSENVAAEKKNSVATAPKTTKPEAKVATTTVAKAVPAVVPGQRAPAATPSPIVKPQAPMLAKSSGSGKLPAAAIPPPSKSAPPAHSASAALQVTIATAPNKSEKPVEHKTQAAVAKTSEPPAPAEGPTHDVVMKVKKPAITAPTKVASKTSTSPKPTATELKATSAVDEEENPAAALTSSKPVAASSAVVKKVTPFPKSTFPKSAFDAPSIATAPATLQNRRELPSATKVSLSQSSSLDSSTPPLSGDHYETAFIKLADGFDFPVGKPDAQGYYRARGYRSHGHQGEDWDGVGGGDTDLGDPIYAIGDGLVVFARDCHMGWGNVVIIRHSYREGATVKTIDSLYGHLLNVMVRKGQAVTRGQKIATMGTAHGLYDAHLHLEVRKNIEIGMSRAAFAQDFTNYYDPSQFIQAHRHLQNGGGSYRVAMNTFTRDARIRWDKVRNYSHPRTGGGSSESAAALKRALAAKNNG